MGGLLTLGPPATGSRTESLAITVTGISGPWPGP